MPDNRMLLDLQEVVLQQYKGNKEKSAQKPSTQSPACAEPVVVTPEAPTCPGSVEAPASPAAPQKWEGRNPTWEERAATKQAMLQIFREQWQRLGKAKKTMGYAEYTTEQKDGLQITGGHRPMQRPKDVLLPRDYREPVGVLSAQQLSKFNCNNERLLISLYGDIFDVSDRPDKYGKEGPYFYFAGRDITWGLVTGQDSEDKVNQFYDLFKMDEIEVSKKMQCICSWLGLYETEYGQPVGRLAEFEAEPDLPPPPVQSGEVCVVQ